MKKISTFFATMMLIATACFAQGNVMGTAKQAGKVAAFGKEVKAVKGLPPLKGKSVKAFNNPVWDSDTMSYCGNEPFYTTVGTSSDTNTMHWGIKIEADALVGRNTINAVHLYVAKAGAYSMNIIFGDDPTESATHTQTINATSADTGAWKVVTLATPVAIPQGQTMWVTFSFTGSYPAAAVMGSTYANGTYASLDGEEWHPLAQFGTSLSFTWMIRVVSDTHVVPAPMLEVEGPTAVLTGVAATWTATSPNTDNWAWYVNGEAANTNTNTLTHTFTSDADGNMIVVEATNNSGANVVYDTIYVDSYTCNGITEIPSFENFENGLRCWSAISADPANDNNFGVFADAQAHGGNNDFRFSSYASAADYNQYLISPEITLPSEGQYMLKFWYKGYNNREMFRVVADTTGADSLMFDVVLDSMTSVATTWTMAAYRLPANTKHVAINYFANFQYYLFIDDISIEELSVPEVTVNGHDYVKVGNLIHYTAQTVLADTLEWFVDNEAVTGNGNTLDYIFTTAGIHSVVAKAANSVGFNTDTIAVEAFACDTNDIPYVPTFDNGFGCWDTLSMLTSGAGWYTTAEIELGYGQVYSMSAQSSFFGMIDLDIDNWLISPYIAAAEGNYEVAWQVRPFDVDYHFDHYSVYVLSGNDTTLIFSETMGSDTNFAWRTVSLPANLGDKFRIAFRHHDCQNGFVLLLDNIQVRALTTPIVSLDGPLSVESGEQVTYTAQSGTATSYIWTVDGVAANETGNALTISFDAAGNHTVSVAGNNIVGTGDSVSLNINVYTCDPISTPWIESFEGNTQCWKFITMDETSNGFAVYEDPQYAYNGNFLLFGTYSDYSDVDQWAISPVINMPEDATGYKFSFYVLLTEYDGVKSNFEVRISNGGSAINDFETVLFSENNSYSNYVQRVVDLSQYAGRSIRIAFHNITAIGGDALLIDNIELSNTVGIDEVAAESRLNLYPNPASQMVSISAEGVEGNVTVSIVDMNGRVMMQQNGNAQSFRFNVSGLAQGAYFVRLTGENVNAVRKLIVE